MFIFVSSNKYFQVFDAVNAVCQAKTLICIILSVLFTYETLLHKCEIVKCFIDEKFVVKTWSLRFSLACYEHTFYPNL